MRRRAALPSADPVSLDAWHEKTRLAAEIKVSIFHEKELRLCYVIVRWWCALQRCFCPL